MHTTWWIRSDWRHTPRPRAWTWFGSAVLIGLGAPLLGRLLLDLSRSVFAENGYIETSQAALLLAVVALFAAAYGRSAGAKAAFCALMTVLSVMALQREIPSCESAFFEGGLCLTRPVKGLVSVGAFAVGLALVLAKGVPLRPVLNLRAGAWIWPVAVAATLLGLAELAERWVHQEMEETLEFGAYAYLAVYAFWVGQWRAGAGVVRPSAPPSPRVGPTLRTDSAGSGPRP